MATLQTTGITGSLTISGSAGSTLLSITGSTGPLFTVNDTNTGVAFQVIGSGSTIMNVSGSLGGLFSVTDSITGNLLTVATGSTSILTVSSSGIVTITGSLKVSGSITSSLFGTASWATNAISASYFSGSISSAVTAQTASYVTSSNVYGPSGANSILSSSYALTASYWSGSISNATSASYASSSTSASYAITASYYGGSVTSASYASSSTSASFATTASYYGGSVTSASYASSSTSASFASTASAVNTLNTGSGVYYPIFVTGSGNQIHYINSSSFNYNAATNVLTVTSSYASQSLSSSFATTASYYGGSVTSASYASSSTSASFAQTASYYGGSVTSASYASSSTSASFASTASYWSGTAVSASYASSSTSASYALTASYALNAGAGSGTVSGSTNYIAMFSSSTTVSSSIIYQSAGNISVGTTSNSARLQIQGTTSTNSGKTLLLQNSTPTTLLTVFDNGNVSIGQDAADTGYRLNVSGSTRIISSGSTVLLVSGSIGPLLSVSDDVSGNLFTIASGSLTILAVSASGNIAIGTSLVTAGAPDALLIEARNLGSNQSYNIISGHSNLNSYTQLNIQNFNAGPNASADIVATNNSGSESTYYIDMGINSSTFTGFVGGANDAYLYTTGSNLWIGNLTANKNVYLFTTSTGSSQITISGSTGFVGINKQVPNAQLDISGSVLITGSLNVSGSISATSFTGSYFGTSSWAISASYYGGSVTSASYASSSTSASFASTASYVVTSQTASYYGGSVTSASYASSSTSASFAATASTINILTASSGIYYALFASGSGSQAGYLDSNITFNATTNVLIVTASYASQSLSSSYATTASYWSGTAVSASYASSSTSASYALSASYAPGGSLSGGVTNYVPLWTGTNTLATSSISQDATGSVRIIKSGSTAGSSILTVSGSTGTLMSINDSVTGNLFSVVGSSITLLAVSSSGNIAINTGSVTAGAPDVLLIEGRNAAVQSYNLVSGHSNINNYSQLNIQNFNNGATASSDIVATNDLGTETTFYVDLGINSSGFASNFIGSQSDAYLYTTGSNFWIGNITANKNLSLFAGSTTTGSSQIVISGSTGFVGINKQIPSTQLDISGSTTITGSLLVSGSILAQKFSGSSILPTIRSGSGAGTAATVSITGSDVAGLINLTAGTTPSANAIICNISFSAAYSTAPYVVFSPATGSSAALSGALAPYVSASTGNFWLVAGSAAIPASTVYRWYYTVIG